MRVATIAAALIALVLVVTPAARADPTIPGTLAPNAMVRDPATGTELVFIVTTGDTLQGFEYTDATGSWTQLPLHGGAAPAPGSQPVVVDNLTASGPNPQGYVAVYYIAANGTLWSYSYTPGGGWAANQLPAGDVAAAGTSPTAVYSPTAMGDEPAGFTGVYYEGEDGEIWSETYIPSQGWTAAPLPAQGPVAQADSSPQAVFNPTTAGPEGQGFIAIFYIADTGNVVEDYVEGNNSWYTYTISAGGEAPAPQTSPAVVNSPGGTGNNPAGFVAVYYVGADGAMWNDNYTPQSGWGAYALPDPGPAPAPGASPSVVVNDDQGAAFNPNGFEALYYVAAGGQVWNDNFTPTTDWTSYPLGADTAATGGLTTPVTTYDPVGGLSRVYFPASDGDEDVWSYSAGWSLTHAFGLSVGPLAQPTPTTPITKRSPTTGTTRLPLPRRGVRVKIVAYWTWSRPPTVLHWVRIRHFPRGDRIAVRCGGHHCPRVARRADARREPALLRSLAGRRFADGDRLVIVISAPHKRAERIEIRIRDRRRPTVRLLGLRRG